MKHSLSKLKIVVAVICAVVFVAVVIIGFGMVERFLDRKPSNSDEETVFSYMDYPGAKYYNGAYYTPKKNLDTLLILGIDSSEDRPDSTQSDFLALLILDRDQESFSVLQLNRDTMVDIPRNDDNGVPLKPLRGQLALAHAYGEDDRARCLNTVHAIETLLYDIDVENFISLTMDAVPILNDSVGGVTVQLLDDFSHVDPSYVKDAVVTLHGSDALTYVRARGELEDSSNLSRMNRQRQYLAALFEKFAAEDVEQNTDAMMDVSEYLVTDYTTSQLSQLLERIRNYTNDGVVTLKGEAVVGTSFMEYHIDEESTKETIIRLFYDPIEEK